MTDQNAFQQVPTASVADTAAAVAEVIAPVVARGAIVRRPGVVRAVQRLDADLRAVRRMQRLHETYGDGPLLLRVPVRDFALVLSPRDVVRVLNGSPEPFSTANRAKRRALERFQPHGVLISEGGERAERRRFNEEVLDSERPVHRFGDEIVAKVADEAAELANGVRRTGGLAWDAFVEAWFRMVRRVILGDAARDDHALTDLLGELRASANWSLLGRRHADVRRRFHRQLRGHLERAEPGSLAALVRSTPGDARTRPEQQVPQWLFAYDAGAWASFRALALIFASPHSRQRVDEELSAQDPTSVADLPYLRACLLDSLRLYPTTPAVLRDTTAETVWETGTLPAGAGVMVFAPFFHRDDRVLEHADAFSPELWLDGVGGRASLGHLADGDWPFIPFSAGPAVCPGRHLVLLTASCFLGVLLAGTSLRLADPVLDTRQLPSALSPFHLRFNAG